MSPRNVVQTSVDVGLDLIAVCDHNSAENVGAAVRVGHEHGLRVLCGLEVNSREEVHVLAIFDTEDQALAMQSAVYAHLRGTNRPEIFGDQIVANEHDEVEGFNDRRLIGATDLGVYEIVAEARRLGGLVIASHVDRPSFSILSQLGFVPPDLELDAAEVSRHMELSQARAALPIPETLPLVTASDAHFPGDIGTSPTSFRCETPGVEELRKALTAADGRQVLAP